MVISRFELYISTLVRFPTEPRLLLTPRFPQWKLEKKFLFFTHQQVVLDLLVHTVEGSLSVAHSHLGVFVFPGPGLVLVCADVFVTQAQRPQGRVGKDLKSKTQTMFPSTGTKETATYMHVIVSTYACCIQQ